MRVLITGAARGIGAALARRLHAGGALVALAGLEPDELAAVARECGDAPWRVCDVGDRVQVDRAVGELVEELGGLDVVVVNAGIAAQLPLVGGDPAVMESILRVNVLGAYYTVRAAGEHIAHPSGYAVLISSLAAAAHLPLLGAYSASKAAVEALGNTLRIELRGSGARVGVAYFAELDTDMTSRGFGTEAAQAVTGGPMHTPAPLKVGVDALVRGIERRSRVIAAPGWARLVPPVRVLVQRYIDTRFRGRRVAAAIGLARQERVGLTTAQPEREA
ncbi:SDR family NAD(P)-dependent oxidoreductase [Actinokineospora pegani]|uniref:SDR family NAD(P)-dependent oxidoreductase n=1 Tax=Actinokineospora pegani TaxID=2654637 RepID=UPI0012EA4A98|nr:SDR family NAD(P)-dependent oxidoreductase [Actinokineospora pegani]